jgi:hypothetical protein
LPEIVEATMVFRKNLSVTISLGKEIEEHVKTLATLSLETAVPEGMCVECEVSSMYRRFQSLNIE